MNKYDLMNDVVPPLTADQMSTRGYGKGGGIGKLLGYLVDPLEESKWVKKIQELVEEKKGTIIQRYLPDYLHQETAGKSHEKGKFDYHPLNVEKELVFDPEAPQFLRGYPQWKPPIKERTVYGKYWEPVPYNEYDAVSDLIENLLINKVGSGSKTQQFFDDYESVVKTIREQIDEVKRIEAMKEAKPQYAADVESYIGSDARSKLKKSLMKIKEIIGVSETPDDKMLNSRGGLHGY